MTILLATFTYGGDEEIAKYNTVAVGTLREAYPEHKIVHYLIDDANNPFKEPFKDEGDTHYIQSNFDRNGNLNGVSSLIGITQELDNLAQTTGADWIIKLDSDSIVMSLDFLNSEYDYIGSNDYNEPKFYARGWCATYKPQVIHEKSKKTNSILKTTILVATFTQGEDEETAKFGAKAIQTLREIYPEHKIVHYLIDDANNPFKKPFKDEGDTHYIQTSFPRHGMYFNKETFAGKIATIKTLADETKADWIINAEADVILMRLDFLNPRFDYIGSKGEEENGIEYVWGKCCAFKPWIVHKIWEKISETENFDKLDEEIALLTAKSVDELRKLYPHYKIFHYIIVDENHPFKEKYEDTEETFFFSSNFKRNGNLCGISAFEGVVHHMYRVEKMSNADWVIKMDSDTVILSLDTLNSGYDFMGTTMCEEQKWCGGACLIFTGDAIKAIGKLVENRGVKYEQFLNLARAEGYPSLTTR
ncbi:unnamed protein product [Cylicocyclus nassatus]|uniref:Uncharacterized protein n=1 Tax=Cylicocyclus nassatus TaxID=53992 RepID=A0AA36GJH7_CYLNA|nr:unnamed protein product [Cylicocyclus nassatus]